MVSLEAVLALEPEHFFAYVKSLKYGYRDQFGKIHLDSDRDFTVKDYSFSSPETIVETKCCWCWDLAEFVELYCERNDIPHKSYFMEYHSDELHQTHSQVFVFYHGAWSAAPDNCLGLSFGKPCYDALESCVEWFLGLFTGYLKSVLKEKYRESDLLVQEYACSIPEGTSEEEYLRIVRQ